MVDKSGRVLTVITRQRLVGPTNGSSTYLMRLMQFAKYQGFALKLIMPSPSVFGRTPFVKIHRELTDLCAVSIRGALTFGDWRIALSPSVWLKGLVGVLIRQLNKKLKLQIKDNKQPYAIGIRWTDADRSFVSRIFDPKTTKLMLDYAFQTDVLTSLPVETFSTAVVMHDLFHTRKGQFDPDQAHDRVNMLTKEAEIELLSKANVVLAIQAAEAEFVRANCTNTRVIVTPMSTEAVDAPQPGSDGTLLFVGSSALPNIVGLNWFISEVWPVVLEAWPNAKLRVAGSVSDSFVGYNVKNIEFLGLLESLEAEYTRAGIVISPLTQGSGLKIKLIESLGRGKMVVATTITTQGVEEQCEGAVFVTDDASEFAAGICKYLYNEALRAEMGGSALAVARHYFSDQAALKEFGDWLQEP